MSGYFSPEHGESRKILGSHGKIYVEDAEGKFHLPGVSTEDLDRSLASDELTTELEIRDMINTAGEDYVLKMLGSIATPGEELA